MAQNKTQATALSVDSYLDAIADPARRADCQALAALMARASGLPAVLWGPAIVGFGRHRYPLAGGKTGDICAVGFASRKGDMAIYGLEGATAEADTLARLGRHTSGKACLYVRRLSEIDPVVLEAWVARAVRARHNA